MITKKLKFKSMLVLRAFTNIMSATKTQSLPKEILIVPNVFQYDVSRESFRAFTFSPQKCFIHQ